jgi:hypothetical protein
LVGYPYVSFTYSSVKDYEKHDFYSPPPRISCSRLKRKHTTATATATSVERISLCLTCVDLAQLVAQWLKKCNRGFGRAITIHSDREGNIKRVLLGTLSRSLSLSLSAVVFSVAVLLAVVCPCIPLPAPPPPLLYHSGIDDAAAAASSIQRDLEKPIFRENSAKLIFMSHGPVYGTSIVPLVRV